MRGFAALVFAFTGIELLATPLEKFLREYALMLASVSTGSVTVGDPTKDKVLTREPAGKRTRNSAAKNTHTMRPAQIPQVAHDVIPMDLWQEATRHLPQPRQINKADQRLSKHGVLAGAVCTEILNLPGRYLPATLADRKTVRTHLSRWKADGTWDTLKPLLTQHPHVRTLMSAAGTRRT